MTELAKDLTEKDYEYNDLIVTATGKEIQGRNWFLIKVYQRRDTSSFSTGLSEDLSGLLGHHHPLPLSTDVDKYRAYKGNRH